MCSRASSKSRIYTPGHPLTPSQVILWWWWCSRGWQPWWQPWWWCRLADLGKDGNDVFELSNCTQIVQVRRMSELSTVSLYHTKFWSISSFHPFLLQHGLANVRCYISEVTFACWRWAWKFKTRTSLCAQSARCMALKTSFSKVVRIQCHK